MSVQASAILLLIGFALAIFVGFKWDVNAGVLGFAAAIIIAYVTGLKYSAVTEGFPTSVVLTLFTVGLFFGFHVENGTMRWIGQSFLYLFRKTPKFLPYAIYLLALIMSICGGGAATVFVAAIAFPVGRGAGMKPWHVGSLCLMGNITGSVFPTGQHGSTIRGIIEGLEGSVFAEQAMKINWLLFITGIVMYLIIVTVLYFGFKSYQLKTTDEFVKPAPMNALQKKSFILICIVLVTVLVPSLMVNIDSSWNRISKYLAVVPVCMIATCFCMLFKLADEKVVLKNRVPWRVISMVIGMGILVNLAGTLGVTEYLGEKISVMPIFTLPALFALFSGVMSLFSSSLSVVYPMMIPIAAAVATASGANPIALFAAITFGAATAAMSPLSSGGGFMMAVCSDDVCDEKTLFNNLFLMAAICVGLITLLGLIGVLGIFHL